MVSGIPLIGTLAILAPLYLLAWLRGDQTARASAHLLVIGSLLYGLLAALGAGHIQNGLGPLRRAPRHRSPNTCPFASSM